MQPKFFGYIFSIPFLKDYLVSTCFVKNVVSQVDIMLIGVRIEICGRDISQLLNFIENNIDWCIDIKSHLFEKILTLGKHLKCNFSVGTKEILEDDVNGILD